MALQCSVCATSDFPVVDGYGNVRQKPLMCETCGAILCWRCADRFVDHTGVKLLACPKCGSRETLIAYKTKPPSNEQ